MEDVSNSCQKLLLLGFGREKDLKGLIWLLYVSGVTRPSGFIQVVNLWLFQELSNETLMWVIRARYQTSSIRALQKSVLLTLMAENDGV